MKSVKYLLVLVAFTSLGLMVFLAVKTFRQGQENVYAPGLVPIQTVVVASNTPTAILPAVTSPGIAASTSPVKTPPVKPQKNELVPVKPEPVLATTTLPTVFSPTISVVPGVIISENEIHISPVWTLIATTTTARWPAIPEPMDREINPQAIVALYCHGKEKGEFWKGTGNIINSKGYILTNRHVAEDAEYCEVAMPDKTIKLTTRAEIADLGSIKSILQISGWRPYKATTFFLPPAEGLSDDEKFELDFAVIKIDSLNEGCDVYGNCISSLPTVFPYNPISNFHMPTSTAGMGFPVAYDGSKFNIPLQPYETLSYGYPAIGSGQGDGHVLRGDLGYAAAYIPGDTKFSEYPMMMIRRVLYGTRGGASGSGVFYKGHIIGLVYGSFRDLVIVESVIPMPLITKILKENGKEWILNPN